MYIYEKQKMQLNNLFYVLKPAVDTQESGSAFPAAESYIDYDFKAHNSVHILKYNEFPEYIPDIRFKLASGAKIVDILSQAAISGHGLLVSERLRRIISQFKIVPHKYYPATIEVNGSFHSFFWLHLQIDSEHDFVDYKKSNFYNKKFSNNLGRIEVESYSDFQNKRKLLGTSNVIGFENLAINPHEFDLFAVPFYGGIYISTSLKELLEKEKLTGLDISIANKLFQ